MLERRRGGQRAAEQEFPRFALPPDGGRMTALADGEIVTVVREQRTRQDARTKEGLLVVAHAVQDYYAASGVRHIPGRRAQS